MPPANATSRRDAWTRPFGRALDVAIVVLVVAASLLVGGMHPVGQAALSLASITLCLGAALLHLTGGLAWRWQPVAGGLAALAALVLLRSTAAGAWLGGAFEAELREAWGGAVSVPGTGAPGRAPLAALRLLGAAAFLQTAAVRLRNRDGTRYAVGGVGVAVSLCVVLGLAHGLLGLDKLYGVYTPLQLDALRVPWAAPYINENQAGALWAIGGVIAFAGAAVSPERRGRLLLAGAALLIPAGILLQAWAAVLAAVLASAVLLVLSLLPVLKARVYATVASTVGGVALVAGALAAWFAVPRMLGDAMVAQKASLWRGAVAPALARPLGWGPGVAPDVAGRFASTPDRFRSAFIESAPLDAAFDHGWLAACGVGAAIGWGLWQRLTFDRRSEVDLRAAVVAVAVFVGVEGSSGMALEADGYLYPVLALLGWALGRAHRRDAGVVRWRVAAGAAALAALTAAALPGLRASAQLGDDASSRLAFGALSDEVLAVLVPSDLSLIQRAASAALREGQTDTAAPLVAHLTRYAPAVGATWDLAVDVALARGDRAAACQAAERLAVVGSAGAWAPRALDRIDADVGAWAACIPDAAARERVLDGLLALERRDEALAMALQILAEQPEDIAALRTAALVLPSWGQLDYAASLGERLVQLAPGERRTALAVARIYAEQEKPAQALEIVRRALEAAPRDPDLRLLELEILAAWDADTAAGAPRFADLYNRLLPLVAADARHAERRLVAGATYYERTEGWAQAENTLRALVRMRPQHAPYLRRLADVLERQGDTGGAAELRERASAHRGRRR